jgi:beta-galactosidase
MRKFLLTLPIWCAALWCGAQAPYLLDATAAVVRQPEGTLDLKGANPNGDVISANSLFITLNDAPFYPVMGEFHFSRYPAAYWEESILKIKAGGINLLATYVFWNVHEPREGVFDWQGDRDLRRFVALCRKHNLFVIVRVGPYGHGEMRSGAMPDWLYGRPVEIRTDDPGYLAYVRKYFNAISGQLKGSLFKEGGTVIGIQLENEYQHAGSAWGLQYPNTPWDYTFAHSDKSLTRANVFDVSRKLEYAPKGTAHMATLKKLALESGLQVPLYTATGWGYAAIVEGGSVPVTAAYAYPSWGALEPSPFYLFKDIRKDPDYGPVRYDTERYPSIAAEMGSGIMITTDKRPLVPSHSITPMMVRTVGSGSNGIGYYMYHGGTTPVQNGRFMSEDIAGVPKISYDFQAPVGEYGQVRAAFNHLKPFNYFLQHFGARIAAMPVVLPETNGRITKENTNTLRFAMRTDGDAGFIFMHNYQDHVATTDLTGLSLKIKTRKGEINIPETGTFTLRKEDYAILPVNLAVGDVRIRYATVQPMVSFDRDGTHHYVFISKTGLIPEFRIEAGDARILQLERCKAAKQGAVTQVKGELQTVFSFRIQSKGRTDHFLVIPESMAQRAWALHDRLVFAASTVLTRGDTLDLLRTGQTTDTLMCYPAVQGIPAIAQATVKSIRSVSKQLSAFQINFAGGVQAISAVPVGDHHVMVSAQQGLHGLNDVFIKVHYVGDRAQAFIDGDMVTDHFYYGMPWEVGLKRYTTLLGKHPMYLYFHPMHKDAPYLNYLTEAYKPDFGSNGQKLEIKSISIVPEFKATLVLR